MSEVAAPVAFHTGVADPVGHTLRLTRKALALGSRVLILAQSSLLRELDEQLWTAEPGSFIAHALWNDRTQGTSALRHAPVWLMAGDDDGDHPPLRVPTEPDVLINLGVSVPSNAGDFRKVIEVVSTSADARAQGQQRWRRWRDGGIAPAHHAFS